MADEQKPEPVRLPDPPAPRLPDPGVTEQRNDPRPGAEDKMLRAKEHK